MAKDPAKLAVFRELEKLKNRLKRDAMELYGSVAIAMHEKGYSDEQIVELIAHIGTIWDEVALNDRDIVTECREKVGIDIQNDIVY